MWMIQYSRVVRKMQLILGVRDKEHKEVKIIDPTPSNAYKTKKNFTGFLHKVNPKMHIINPCVVLAIGYIYSHTVQCM